MMFVSAPQQPSQQRTRRGGAGRDGRKYPPAATQLRSGQLDLVETVRDRVELGIEGPEALLHGFLVAGHALLQRLQPALDASEVAVKIVAHGARAFCAVIHACRSMSCCRTAWHVP